MGKSSLFVSMVLVVFLVFTISCVSKEVPVTETYYETEYETEYKTETYTETEDVVVSTSEGKKGLSTVSKWHAGIYFRSEGSGAGGTYYYGYALDPSGHTRSQVKIKTSSAAPGHIGVYDLAGIGQIPVMPATVANWREANPETGELWMTAREQEWLDNLNALLTNPERILGNAESGGEISFDAEGIKEFAILANTWNTHAITSVQLVWSDDIVEQRTVTKERQVPYQVPVEVEKQRTVTEVKKVPFWEVMLAGETPSTAPAAPPASPEPVSTNTTLEAEPPVLPPSLLYEDDFSDPHRGFLGDIAETCEIYNKDNEYHVLVKERDWSCWDFNYIKGPFTDFALEIDAMLIAGPNQSGYGLIFRVPVPRELPIIDDFYLFLVNGNGYYSIGTRTDEQWAVLKAWTKSEFINEGYSTNHLKVVCEGSKIEVYANGHHLTTITDESFASGRVGVIVDTSIPGAHAVFDNLKVYSLAPETQ